jgi:FtsP/CotA-like multicopper oxidase with cupredoxin domain
MSDLLEREAHEPAPGAPVAAPDPHDDERSQGRSFVGWLAFGVALGAIILGVVALAQDDGGGGAAAAAPTVVDVELGAMKIVPEHIAAPAGPLQIRVTNTDSAVHNFSALGQTTPDLQPGETYTLDLGDVAPGTYDVQCDVPGHAAAGMTGMLMVGEAAAGGADAEAAADDHLHGYASWQEMEAAMTERSMRFVEEEKGTFGGQPLEPTILADGTKRFEVTASIVDWEVEPGVIVQAWTYNGTVPAPSIHVEVGDQVELVLHNELPQATTIHLHGIRVPNAMDGVPPYTQEAVAPGESFTYAFEAIEPAVGIYHSHNGADQVLDGLFGAFTIGEMPTPDVLLEQGFAAEPDQEINMILNDAGVIGLTLNGKSFPATELYTATVGDTVLVNYYNEGLQAHPMHMHQPLGWVIAKDGKPLLTPEPTDTVNVAPGERYTVLYKMQDPGVWAWHCHILTHAERADGMFGMVTAFVVEAA